MPPRAPWQAHRRDLPPAARCRSRRDLPLPRTTSATASPWPACRVRRARDRSTWRFHHDRLIGGDLRRGPGGDEQRIHVPRRPPIGGTSSACSTTVRSSRRNRNCTCVGTCSDSAAAPRSRTAPRWSPQPATSCARAAGRRPRNADVPEVHRALGNTGKSEVTMVANSAFGITTLAFRVALEFVGTRRSDGTCRPCGETNKKSAVVGVGVGSCRANETSNASACCPRRSTSGATRRQRGRRGLRRGGRSGCTVTLSVVRGPTPRRKADTARPTSRRPER